jgi:dihydroorotate dehydrogenase
MARSTVSAWAYRLARPFLFRFDPERIHNLTIRALRGAGEHPAGRAVLAVAGAAPRHGVPVTVGGLVLRNRIGVGAGFDKDGVALRGWAALGLGFAEVGTVTPLPQTGNPRPRLFRLSPDEALVNRMGFNNAGAAELARHGMLARRFLPRNFAVGVNIGRNRTTPDADAAHDYAAAFRLVAPVADYVAINVSSPNTPGLRDMQTPATLAELLATVRAVGTALALERPLLVKLAPDLADETLLSLLRAVRDAGASGVILGNTTVARQGLRSPAALTAESGGLSGRPLLSRTLETLVLARAELGPNIVLVASGGLGSAADVAAAVAAGADLVQLWTGLVYRGPGLIGEAVAATS